MLSSIIIPNSVTIIESQAFNNCYSLETITIHNKNIELGYNVFLNTAWLKQQPNGCIYINNYLYTYKGTMPENSHINIKEGTTIIGSHVFNHSNLKSIVIPDSVNTIASYTFINCPSLTTITSLNTTPPNTKDITRFLDKEKICVEVPKDTKYTYKKHHEWKNFSKIIEIEIGQCGSNAFYKLTEDGILSIFGFGPMYDYKYNKYESYNYKCPSPFYINKNIHTIIIQNGITSIGDYAFPYCEYLTTVNIPDSVTSIGDCAFFSCESLTTINIPDSVTSIGNKTFARCLRLFSINKSSSISSEKTPMIDIGKYAFAETHWLLKQSNGCIYINNCLYTYKGKMQKNTHINVQENITQICANAFYDCIALKSIKLPNNLNSIESMSFFHCTSLKKITIPNSTNTIEHAAFYRCTSLQSITIENSVKKIGYKVFYKCTSLTTIISLNPTPPEVFYNNLGVNYDKCTLKIPKGTKNTYTNHEEWGKFKNIEEFEPLNEDVIETINNNKNYKIFTPNGQLKYIGNDRNIQLEKGYSSNRIVI